MTDTIESRRAARNITLPEAAAPAANYLPYVITGSHLFISGQLPMESGSIAVKGLLGRDVDVGTGQRAAELCAINILAQAKAALGGDLERIVPCEFTLTRFHTELDLRLGFPVNTKIFYVITQALTTKDDPASSLSTQG